MVPCKNSCLEVPTGENAESCCGSWFPPGSDQTFKNFSHRLTMVRDAFLSRRFSIWRSVSVSQARVPKAASAV